LQGLGGVPLLVLLLIGSYGMSTLVATGNGAYRARNADAVTSFGLHLLASKPHPEGNQF
jgi:hypothetical protein